MEDKRKVTNIKYKRMDKDHEIKDTINGMEKMVLGDKGVGLLEHLGLTPGTIQKSLDEQWDKDFEALLEEHKEFIFWESRKRSAACLEEWMNERKDSNVRFTQEDVIQKMQSSLKHAELDVLKELVEKYL